MRFDGFDLFKKNVHIYKLFNKNRLIHTTQHVTTNERECLERTPLPPETQKFYDRHKSSILYSSFIENNKLHLGYIKNRILTKLLKRQESQIVRDNVKVKPFSLALKYWNESKDDFDENAVVETNPKDISDQLKIDLVNQFSHNHRKEHFVKDFKESKFNYVENEEKPFVNDWMNDYDIYNDSESNVHSQFGTPDPSVPISKIPCYGCGALLHCADSSLPGYLPSELFKQKRPEVLKTVTCQRCHFLKNYNTAINIKVSPEQYIEMISTIQDKYALAIVMVDLLDFPCSLWPDIASIIGTKRPVFIVGNKVDLLPKDSLGHLHHVQKCLENCVTNSGIAEMNIKHVCLISAQTGYGVEELITKLHNVWEYKGDVYLIGCTNVGKSSLFNALLRSDYCKVKASNIIQKATASPWPGTTIKLLKFPILRPSHYRLYVRTQRLLSERSKKEAESKLRADQSRIGKVKYATLIGHIGQTFSTPLAEVNDNFSMGKGAQPILTLDEEHKDYKNSRWCYDTPGVVHDESILNLLTTEELLLTLPKAMITPRTYLIKPGMSLFLAGLGRIDYLNGLDWLRCTVYSSSGLPTMIVKTDEADCVYKEALGTELLGVPTGDEERLQNWPGLKCSDIFTFIGEGARKSACDILLSSAGWVGLNIPQNHEVEFKVWTPQAKGIFIRKPSLIPYGANLRGDRIKGSLAYSTKIPFVKPIK